MPTQSAGSASSVCFAGFHRYLIVALWGVAFAALFPRWSSAQVTYADFNTPAANSGQSSATCSAASAAPGVLFCFNYTGNGLSFIQDNSYTTTIDPSETGGTAYALQLTQSAESQASSVWYAIPQNVASGFTAWYAFKITPGIYPPGDGLAFVIQNAAGGGVDSLALGSCAETGSGLTALGGGGGCIGYGGIDNSVALEADTFADSYDPWDAGTYNYTDNHIAMQDCGAGLANSPAHYTDDLSSPLVPTSCLISLGGTYAIASNPASSATASTVYIYDGAPHQVVIVYNGPNDSPANYLYVYLDPAFMPGTHTPVAGSTPIFSGPFDITKSINLNNGAAYIGFTGATGGDYQQNELMGFSFTPHNFASANVCPSGQTSPAPCTDTIPVTVNVAANTVIGSAQVVTQGALGLDFSLNNAGTCTGTVSGSSCTVNVNFTPTAPGLRMGAVNLFASSSPGGTPLATTLIYGVGQGPAVAFGPGTQTTVNTQGNALSVPNGVVVDAAGDVFIAEGGNGYNGQVLKVPANGGQPTTVGTGLDYPQGLALDGAGNLYIADNNLNEVVKVTPAGVQTEMNFGLNSQLGVAVDGAGDLFVSSYNGHEVVEVPANGGAQTVVYSPGGSSNPIGLAADAAGDLFIADYGLHEVVEVPANGGAQTTIGTGWSQPEAVAVDAAGDVFVADEAPKVVEVPAGCINNSACQITISGTYAYGVAVDGKGNVYIPDRSGSAPYNNADNTNNQVIEINKAQPPSLTFADTYEGSTSSDSPQTVSVQNVGNATLNFATISFPTDFPQVGDDNDCSTGTPLTPGLVCPLTIDFKPTTLGSPLSEAVGLTDNALNAIPGATQNISVQGNGLSPEVNVPNVVGQTQTGAAGLLSTAGLNLGAVTSQASTLPIGEVVSENPAAGTLAQVGSSVSVVLSSGVAVPSVVGQMEGNAEGLITGAGLTVGTVTNQFSDTVQSGNVISQNPAVPSTVNGGTPVSLVVSSGVPPATDQLALVNNYFVTGDYATAGITLHGLATGTITIPDPSPCAPPNCGPGVPDGADIIDGFLYWTTIETSASPSGNTGTFLGYSITGQQIGSDVPNYSDGTYSGTLRVYRADVNNYFQIPSNWNGARQGSGPFAVTLPNSGGTITEGASLVVIWRVLSPNFPLKSVVLYNGSIAPTSATGPIPQALQGFYDAVNGANGSGEVTHLYTSGGSWNDSESSQTLGQSNQYIDTLTTGNAYAAVILSTPVNNSDNDGILDAWKAAQGYTDVKTGALVPLPGATHGEKDLFVQFDYMCSALNADNTCDFTQPNLYPSPDAQGNDPLAMVTQAFANYGVHLHLKPGNAIQESTCTDSATQFCEFPNQPGVVAWNGSVELSKVWPVNYSDCTSNPSLASCAPRFPYGQKDSYHYVLFGYSLAIPAWTTRAGSITSITTTGGTNGGTGTIVTTGLGTTCPTRITISGVQGNPNLNAIYDGVSCDSGLTTINFSTSSTVPTWTYPNNTLPEPVIAVTSGKVTSISGYSDLGGSDSVVSLGQWESSLTQDMSKSATVVAGTLFHEIGHTLGLSHGGLYFDTPGSYIPTFEANCKPNYQSSMNYLFQLDGVGPNAAVTYSNQALFGEIPGASPTITILGGDSSTTNPNFTTIPFGSVVNLTDNLGNPASFTTSAWYSTTPPSSTASPATRRCDGSPLNNDTAYRVDGPVDAISPAWTNGQNITFDGAPYSDLRGYSDQANLDLRQVGATSGDFASLASETSYSGAGVTFAGSGGVTFAGSGGVTFAGSGGVTFAGSGGVLFAGSGGVLFAGSGGVTFAGSGGVTYAGSGGVTFAGSGGVTFAGSGGVTFAGSGGVTFAGSGGASTNELDYVTANSFVRPPNSPTITPVMTSGVETSVTVDWMAPPFGVVQYYTVYRGCNPNGSDAVDIGVVNGVGGAAPATEFIDSNPITCSGSSGVVYTIATTLNPVQIDPTQRSSAPSVPAIVKNLQTIVLGSLQSSVTYSTPPPTVTVTATAETNGSPNGLQVNFVATGPCSVGGQTVASIASGGASTATVTINDPGSNPATCTVVASQSGTNPMASSMPPYYDAANSVSESFTIEPAGSNLQSQTIGWSTLSNVQYGGTFSLSATAESNGNPDGQPVTFTATGPCTTSGATTGVGRCTITASQVGGSTYSPASVSQSFNITPAVLTVTATSFPSVTYEQAIPALTYTITGYASQDLLNGSPKPVVTGTPVLSTTATQGSSLGPYPITATTGTLAAANYSFLFANGTLTIVPASQAITFTMNAPSTAAYNSSFTVAATGGASGNPVSFSSSGSCSNIGAIYTMTSGTGMCTVIANQAGSTNYSAAQPVTQTVNATLASPAVAFTGAPANAAYNSHFTVTATTNASTTPTITSSGACSNLGTAITMTSGTGICSLSATWAADSNYSGATATQSTTASKIAPTITFTGAPASAAYNSSFTVAATTNASATPTITSGGACSNAGGSVTMTSGTGTCSLSASWAADSNYSSATATQSTTASKIAPMVTFTGAPPSAAYNSKFTVAATTKASTTPTITSSGACSNIITAVTMTSGTGSCSLTATWAADNNYLGATATQSTTATLAAQVITFTLNAPPAAVYNNSFTVAATGGASGNAVAFTSSGSCSNSGTKYTMISGTGPCSVIANQAGTANYYAAAPPITQTVNATLAAQTITFTTTPPATAPYNSTFIVAASASSGLPVTYSSTAGVCTNTGSTYTMINSVGTCTVTASQAGSTNYSAATPATKNVTATGPVVTVSPSNISFGTVYLGSIITQNITVSNIGNAPVTISQPLISIVKGGTSNEFVAANLCPTPLTAGKSCTITIAFVAGPIYSAQSATLEIMDNAPSSPQPVTLGALVIDPLATFSPTSLAFGTIKHASSSTLNVTLSNTGATPLNFSGAGISVTGTNATDFVQSNTCGSSLAAGAKCTIAVKFTPPTTGSFSANLTFFDNAQAGSGTQTVPLSGKGN
jgi:sugar lactone lactonase YvrE